MFVSIPAHWGIDFEDEQQIRQFSRTPCHDRQKLYSEERRLLQRFTDEKYFAAKKFTLLLEQFQPQLHTS